MQIPFSNDQKRRTLFRVLSIILGAVSILLFFWDAWMGFYSLLTAALFLMCYCGWIPQLEKLPWLLAVPAIPMIVYDFYRVYLFMLQMFRHGASKYDVWYTLEVLLLALTYLFFVVLVFTRFKVRWLKITVLVLCGVCVLLGIWDILDGTWVLFNKGRFHSEDTVVKRFFLYYIPDIFFWINPFLMLGSVAAREKL
ncbi:MAG: hypothetical protein IKS35_04205 [Clostridia bacterium]|nr:hypothetical protein [Clostridia bacterium]